MIVMAIFSLSDLLIFVTLCGNALCLLASKSRKVEEMQTAQEHVKVDIVPATTGEEEPSPASMTVTLATRLESALDAVRKLSGVILLWNLFFFVLMLFIFSSN